MEKYEKSVDRLRLDDHRAYLGCCTFLVVGLSLFHMGFEWAGWGVVTAAWAMSFKRDVLDEKGGE